MGVVIHHLCVRWHNSIYVEGEHDQQLWSVFCREKKRLHSTYPISPCESMKVYGIAKNNIVVSMSSYSF